MEDFVKLIRDAAAQVGVAASRVWPHVVMTTFYQSLVMLVMVTLVLLGATVFLVLGWRSIIRQARAMEEAGYSQRADTITGDMCWITVIFVGVMIICFLLLPHAVSGVFEPEGQTVRDLLGK